jgi:hypothetical protein
MKHLGIALAISFVAALAVFGIAYPISDDAHISEGLAAIPIIGCHHLAELLERREAKQSLRSGQKIVIQSLDGFSISWPLMAAYGTFVLVAIILISSLLTGVFLALLDVVHDATVAGRVGLALSIPVQVLAAYFVGRWIGARNKNRGVTTVFVMALFSSIMAHMIDIIGLSAEDFKAMHGFEKSMQQFFTGASVSFVFQFLPALLGYWRGSRRRIAQYLHYLLAILPADTKSVLIDLAFQEANREKLKRHQA